MVLNYRYLIDAKGMSHETLFPESLQQVDMKEREIPVHTAQELKLISMIQSKQQRMTHIC